MTRKSTPESPDQGFLFGTELVSSGVTDALLQTHSTRIVEGEGFPEVPQDVEIEQTAEQVAMSALVKQATKTRHRQQGQTGKHTPLDREGRYADLENGTSLIKAGDFLPGFGPVTYRNMVEAESHAYKLEQQRQSSSKR